MTDITATLKVESPDIALTSTVAYDETAIVQPVSGAGTVSDQDFHLFTVRTDDFDRFETGLSRDDTIETYERVVDLGAEAIYRFEYDSDATVFSEAIAEVDGVSLDWINNNTTWTVQVWFPDRAALASLWEYASDHDIEFSLERVSNHATLGESNSNLTQSQRDAIFRAYEMGYFEEPRAATLDAVAAELGITQPAASGLIRRGINRLIASLVAGETDEPGPNR